MRPNLKKITSFILTVSILSGFIFFVSPTPKAEAIIGIDTAITSGICSLYSSTIGSLLDSAKDSAVTAAKDGAKDLAGDVIKSVISDKVPVQDSTVADKIDALKATNKQLDCESFVKKVALGTLKKRILDSMVDQIVNWIQYGDDYKPRFITDFNGFVNDAANVAVGDLVQEVGLGAVCKPLKLSLQFSLLPQKTFSQRASCTLDQIVSNLDNFYNDLTGFNFVAYNTALQPQNNYYGAMLLASDEKLQRVADALNNAQNEIVTGGGYLSQKRCLEWTFKDSKGNVVTTQGPTSNNKAPGVPSGNQGSWRCTQEEIVTPGQTLGNLAAKTVGSDFEFIINADDLSQYVAAIGDALINRLISDTARGLAGMRKPTIYKVDQGPTGCEGLTGTALSNCLSSAEDYSNDTFSQYVSGARDNFQKSLDNTSSSISNTYEAAKIVIAKNDSIIKLITEAEPNSGVNSCFTALKGRAGISATTTAIADANLKVAESDLATANQDNVSLPGQFISPFTNNTGLLFKISYIKSEASKTENQTVDGFTKLSNELDSINNDYLAPLVSSLALTRSRINTTYDREFGFLNQCKSL